MDKRIRVLIVDDSEAARELLGAALREKEDIEIAGSVENGLEALEALRAGDVGVMLLDMVMPKLDGFGVLSGLRRLEGVRKPRIIAVTALVRDDFIQRAVALGVDYYMLKPFDPENVYAHIQELVRPDDPSACMAVRAPQASSCSMDERIANIFLSMGIPAHIKGYHYLREAIKLVVSDREMINAITKDLYPTVALTFGTTSSKVERAIRHAIDVAWNRGQMENINLLFGTRIYVKHDKPTNGEFIAMIADRLAIEQSA